MKDSANRIEIRQNENVESHTNPSQTDFSSNDSIQFGSQISGLTPPPFRLITPSTPAPEQRKEISDNEEQSVLASLESEGKTKSGIIETPVQRNTTEKSVAHYNELTIQKAYPPPPFNLVTRSILQKKPNPIQKTDSEDGTKSEIEARFNSFSINDDDLGNPYVINRLENLSVEQLDVFRSQVKVKSAENRKPTIAIQKKIFELMSKLTLNSISTPLQENAILETTPDGATVTKQKIQVAPNYIIEVVADETDNNLQDSGSTDYKINSSFPGYDFDNKTHLITGFHGDVPDKLIVTITTYFKPGIDKMDDSKYGIGTREVDKKNHNTSLRFHEGSHGIDLLESFKKIKVPISFEVGKIKKEEYDEFCAAIKSKLDTVKQDSYNKTDMVGTPKPEK